MYLAVGLPSHPSDGDGPLGTVSLSGPKVSSSHCPFPFSYRERVSPSFLPSLSLSLRMSIPISHFSLLRLLLRQVNTPIRTRGPTCARTHRLRVVSFGPLLPRQLATARPRHGRKYRVSEYYHQDHPRKDPWDVTRTASCLSEKESPRVAVSLRVRH